ncbi:hypothetical protein [Sulfuritortus calidifontis]|uniref:hypothetical protein n=1 Tax=Sulfuritortus calidifontis TaxID=1914471 RepID=UPI000F8335BC|nr:hypothetical protein [Sulfuritortus calidifontis]
MSSADWSETYKSLITLATEGFKFCALTNGGAAVAILAYLGNVAGKECSVPDMRYAMASFLAGLLFCGLGMLFAYLAQLKRLNRLVEQQDTKNDCRLYAALFFVVLSLAMFGIGSWLAVESFS